MKKYLFLLLLVTLSCLAQAHIYTVSNSPTTPAQYATLDLAVTAASSGDTLYIMGTPNNYILTSPLTKPLTFLGTGFNPQKQISNVTSISGPSSGPITIKSACSGSNFIGVSFSNGLNLNEATTANIHDVRFEFCLGSVNLSNGTTTTAISNIVIKSCGNEAYQFAFTVNNTSATTNNILITNCVLYGSPAIATSSSSNTLYDHNIFRSTGCSYVYLHPFNNSILTSNIIINDDYCGTPLTITGSNELFNNNIYIYGSATSFPGFSGSGTGNLGVGNISFVCADAGSQNCSGITDYHLQPSSPGVGAGVGGTDVGIYDGTSKYFWSGEPQWFPVINKFDVINPTVPQNGTLNIHVESRKARDGQQ